MNNNDKDKEQDERPPSLSELIEQLRQSGLSVSPYDSEADEEAPLSESLDQRLEKIFDFLQKPTKIFSMLFVVMYDIQDNRIRTAIARYLIEHGMVRIQKSVYLGNLPPQTYKQISEDLQAVNEMYENQDSILVLPLSRDELRSMKVIGKELQIDLMLGNNNTFFF
ncbi:MAG: hypothetical protein KatS3mg033_1188 [Thermonema sp.]|uniref:CRISPR-associated endonuclease Cas2 n=1 Tax=Thermonema sp. TaxID=2231181 RepID=UPI0021DD422E|nr:CRISPR-associated endonuclease Cas2 [Thermonema sp.]GIV39388.1 MAG: hypothetical protein KatS3mg033_1188 [Thermonema sp.]